MWPTCSKIKLNVTKASNTSQDLLWDDKCDTTSSFCSRKTALELSRRKKQKVGKEQWKSLSKFDLLKGFKKRQENFSIKSNDINVTFDTQEPKSTRLRRSWLRHCKTIMTGSRVARLRRSG